MRAQWLLLMLGIAAAGPAAAQVALPSTNRTRPALPGRAVQPAAPAADTTIATLAPMGPRTDDMPAPAVTLADPQPASVRITWNAIVGAMGYRIYRNDLGLLTPTDLPLTRTEFTHAAPNDYRVTYTYRVVALYPNGHTGPTSINFTPPRPENAGDFTAYNAPGHVTKFTWQPPPNYQPDYYLLLGPGLDEGVRLPPTVTSYEDGLGLRPGTYTYTVAAMYGSGAISTPANEWPRDNFTVFGGRYRFTIVGFTAVETTRDDNQLDLDGKGDEVFLAAATRVYDPGEPKKIRTTVVRSRVYGDANGAPARVRAGTRSELGGLRDGDAVIPPGKPSGTPADSVLPLVAWEGDLIDDDVLVFRPMVFESDREPPGHGEVNDFENWRRSVMFWDLGNNLSPESYAKTWLLTIPAVAQDLRNREPGGARTGIYMGFSQGVLIEANRAVGQDRAITFTASKASFFIQHQVPVRMRFEGWDQRGGKYLVHVKIEKVG